MSRILLADDNPGALRLGEQILTAQGLQVVSVTDGDIALRRLQDVDPDLLIVDVYLPTKNGFEIARYLRSQKQYKDLPIVFAAAPVDKFEEQDARNAGADAILRKPFEASLLLAAIQPLLEKSKARRESGSKEDSPGGLSRATVHAAVTLALDVAMPALIEELTDRVMLALSVVR